jgi:Ca2+-binding EF-hand superfamily protein
MVYTIDKFVPENELMIIFNYMDRNKKGFIDADNLKACLI